MSLPSWEKWVRVGTAMERLGLSRERVLQLCREGRINSMEAIGELWLVEDDVEGYARVRACGSPATVKAVEDEGDEEDEGGEEWITTGEAAVILGVDRCQVNRLGKRGKLTRRIEGTQGSGGRSYFLRHEVERRAREVEAVRCQPNPRRRPWVWGNRGRTPVLSAWDRLITVEEAAVILDVQRVSVHRLVTRGQLPAYQRVPGKRGSPLLLPHSYVLAYSERPERLKQRAAWEKARRSREQGNPRITDGWEDLDREIGMAPILVRKRSASTERDYGEFFTTRQTALLLGVAPESVRTLRITGRLKGYQRPRRKTAGAGHRWWFFKKEDVYDLLADSQYGRKRGGWDRSQTPAAKARREAERMAVAVEEAEACLRANAYGRDPRGECVDTGWVWGDARVRETPTLGRDPADPPGGPWAELERFSEGRRMKG